MIEEDGDVVLAVETRMGFGDPRGAIVVEAEASCSRLAHDALEFALGIALVDFLVLGVGSRVKSITFEALVLEAALRRVSIQALTASAGANVFMMERGKASLSPQFRRSSHRATRRRDLKFTELGHVCRKLVD